MVEIIAAVTQMQTTTLIDCAVILDVIPSDCSRNTGGPVKR